MRAGRECEPALRADCPGRDRNAGAGAAAHTSHLNPLKCRFPWRKRLKLLLRIEVQGQQVASAEPLQGVEIEADDIGGRDKSGIHTATVGQGRGHGSEVRSQSEKADPARQGRQRRSRQPACVRFVRVKPAEESRPADRQRAVGCSDKRAPLEHSERGGRARAGAAGGEQVDSGGQACLPLLRALLPREQRKERLSVYQQDALPDSAMHLYRRGRRGEREIGARSLPLNRGGHDRDVVRRRGGETSQTDDVTGAQRSDGAPKHGLEAHRAPLQPACRHLGRRPPNRRRKRRHPRRARTREREAHTRRCGPHHMRPGRTMATAAIAEQVRDADDREKRNAEHQQHPRTRQPANPLTLD